MKFYRVTTSIDGLAIPLGPIPWVEILHRYGGRTYADRRLDLGGSIHVFEPRPTGNSHLAIHRLKNESEFLNRISADGTLAQVMAVDSDGAYADTSVVSFMRFGNIFGMVTGGVSAPRHSKVAEWLNRVQPLDERYDFDVHPLVAQPDLSRLEGKSGARRVEVVIPTEHLRAPADGQQSSVGSTLRELATQVPEADLRLTFSFGHRRPPVSEAGALLALARDLAATLAEGSRAEASVFEESLGGGKLVGEVVDLVEYHLAGQFEVGLADEGIMIDSALRGIDRVASDQAGALRRPFEVEELTDEEMDQ